MTASLLPPNASETEHALAASTARISELPVDGITDLWSFHDCPTDDLDHLAAVVDVLEWDPDWTSQQKRFAIRMSVEAHRLAGTRRAVDLAAALCGVAIDIEEWWETNPQGQPHTAKASISGVDECVARALVAVRKAAPARVQFDFTQGSGYANSLELTHRLRGWALWEQRLSPPLGHAQADDLAAMPTE